MRLAMATWNERVSPVFDVARQALVLDIEGGEVVRQQKEVLPGTDSFRQASRVAELAPDVLICGAVSRPMAWALSALAHSCRVLPFVSGSVDNVLRAWQEGRLPSPALSMPGCRARRGRRGGGGTGGRIRGGRRMGRGGNNAA